MVLFYLFVVKSIVSTLEFEELDLHGENICLLGGVAFWRTCHVVQVYCYGGAQN